MTQPIEPSMSSEKELENILTNLVFGLEPFGENYKTEDVKLAKHAIFAHERDYAIFILEHLESSGEIWFRDDDGDAMPIEEMIDTFKATKEMLAKMDAR